MELGICESSPGRRAIVTEEEKGNYALLLELDAAFNAHDLDRIMGHFAEDATGIFFHSSCLTQVCGVCKA